jgi:methionyl aminopeptidase
VPRRPTIEVKTTDQLRSMRRAGLVVARTLDAVVDRVGPGTTTRELDAVAASSIAGAGAQPSFLGYGADDDRRGFPGVVCLSVDDEVVHGVPGERVLVDGDLLSIDCGAIIDGWHGDAAFSMEIGTSTPSTQRLITAADDALAAAIRAMVPGGHLGDIGAAIDAVVSRAGYGSPHDYCGHGIGRAMHEDPDVENRGKRGRGPLLEPGVVLAIEPMLIGGGRDDVLELDDDWTVVTADGSLAAHVEHTVLVTDHGPEILTRP